VGAAKIGQGAPKRFESPSALGATGQMQSDFLALRRSVFSVGAEQQIFVGQMMLVTHNLPTS
jgi:hypothetical protein